LKVASHVVAEWREHQLPADRLESVDENTLADEAVPEFALEVEIGQALLERTLQDMSPMRRAVLLLRFRENRRCSDIARELRLTERQVRRHLTRGYEQLRDVLMS
jgi:RNA polymerase sigma factor (sigma-70 family)